jgi:HSP20 family protein
MTFLRFEPVKEFDTFNNRINKFFNDHPGIMTELTHLYNPKIDISEDEKNIYIEAELPGVGKENVKVSLQENILTISGEKKFDEEKNKGRDFCRKERLFGTISKSINIFEEIAADKIEANFENGILSLTVPKAINNSPKERVINIK